MLPTRTHQRIIPGTHRPKTAPDAWWEWSDRFYSRGESKPDGYFWAITNTNKVVRIRKDVGTSQALLVDYWITDQGKLLQEREILGWSLEEKDAQMASDFLANGGCL